MRMRHRMNWLDRRRFLVGSAAALAGGTSVAWAQTVPAKESPKLSARIAAFATGFDLAQAPPLAIERAPTISSCDPAGCWVNAGNRLRHVTPNLMAPGGLCALAPGAAGCP